MKHIGFVAPSSVVPQVEFRMGLDRIREAGFRTSVHPHCRKNHLFFAGRDEERACAFFEYARAPELDIVWCARGGYGAMRLLPHLRALAKKSGKPRQKLLVGYSDATALHEFVRREWGWMTLHAPMPGMRRFCAQTPAEWKALVGLLRGSTDVAHPWEKAKLRFVGARPARALNGELVGGNLTVWNSLLGTSYFAPPRGKIVFWEDIDEPLYRLDRVLQQIALSGVMKGARAIVLGNFLNCRDTVASVLAREPAPRNLERVLSAPKPTELKPLRKKMDTDRGLRDIFGAFGHALKIPVAMGLPVGHGPEIASLPLGAEYRLTPAGGLELTDWAWTRR